ncbi:MAG: hypothetical protein ACKO0M_05790 [Cyanobium sp.]
MTRNDPPRVRRPGRASRSGHGRSAALGQDHSLQHPQLEILLQDTYRQLEHAYHCSPEYGRMVELYPVLARSIAQCRQAELQGEPTLVGDPPPALRLLPEVRRTAQHIDHHRRQRQRHGDHHGDGTGVVG